MSLWLKIRSSSILCRVLIFTLYFTSLTIAFTSFVVWRRMYLPRPANFLVEENQQIMASTSCRGSGVLLGLTSMSPREISISSLSVMATDIGGKASSSSPSMVWMALIVDSKPEGMTLIGSPGLKTPPAIRPAKPRKSCHLSECGRMTHCTGKRAST